MNNSSYDEASVVRSLSKHNGVRINVVQKHIVVDKANHNIGNGGWGKIDYLIKVHDYVLTFSTGGAVVNKKNDKKDTEEQPVENKINNVNNKSTKNSGINMAKSTKRIMGKIKISRKR